MPRRRAIAISYCCCHKLLLLDEAFGKFLQGKASHRLAAAKALLCSTEPSVIAELAKWRKGAHYLHANAQWYFVSMEEWGALRGKPVVLEKTTYSLQSVVAKQLLKLIQDVRSLQRASQTLTAMTQMAMRRPLTRGSTLSVRETLVS